MIKILKKDLINTKNKLASSIVQADLDGLLDASIQLRLAHVHICSAINHVNHEGELRHGEMLK